MGRYKDLLDKISSGKYIGNRESRTNHLPDVPHNIVGERDGDLAVGTATGAREALANSPGLQERKMASEFEMYRGEIERLATDMIEVRGFLQKQQQQMSGDTSMVLEQVQKGILQEKIRSSKGSLVEQSGASFLGPILLQSGSVVRG